MVGRPIRIMVVGVPNVGKSSLINRLCKGGNAGKSAVQDKPGVTRRNQWFTIGKGPRAARYTGRAVAEV